MRPNTSDSEAHISPLPQCGFGTDFEFNSLIKSNQFLYRVYTPKERSPFADETDPFFIAPRFDELAVRTPADIIASTPWEWSYVDVARHMEWTTRTSSPYVSASFSFAWAIWEAVRRYHTGMKKDVEIAVIDACALDGQAATAVQLLKQRTEEERNDQFEKWYRFSHDSQSVLVYGMVPRTAVLASVPLLQILRKMPSYFLRNDIRVIEGNPLAHISWDYARRKQNFRQFCREISKNIMGKSADIRLRDSTAGSVRLGLSFLQPFLHAVVRDHFDVAVSYLRSLSIAISEWPNGGWVNDHPEVHQIIEVMVLAVVEELRAKYLKKDKEALSLEQVKHSIKVGREARKLVQDVGLYSDDEFGAEFEESDEPTLVNPIYNSLPPSLPLHGQIPLHVPIIIPRIPISIQTPITPPESPRNSLFIPAVSVSTPSEDVIVSASTPKQLALSQEAVFSKEEVSPFESQPSIVSNNLAYLPITPPAENVIFSHTQLETIIEDENDFGIDASHASSPHEVDHRRIASDSTLVAEDAENDDCAGSSDAREISTQSIAFPSIASRHAADGEEQDDTGDVSDDGQDAESFEHVTMPVFPWSGIRQLGSPLSSRRSSIISLETLCEPIEFPIVKRLSFTSMSDSYDLVPTMRSVVLSSRSASFSGMSPPILPITPPDLDVVVDPLPPPLLQSEQSHCPSPQLQPVVPPVSDSAVDIVSTPSCESEHSGELSRSISTTSSSSFSTFSSDLVLPLITPLPPSPVWSVYSLPSSISASSSSTSLSAPQTPVPHPRELSSHEPGSSTISVGSFRPPGKPIGILAPLANQDPNTDHAVPRRRRRVAVVSETASYVVTGFLVGAFLTLFLFSTQRKTILYVT